MEFKKCPFCGNDKRPNIIHKKEKRKRYGIYHSIVTLECSGMCTVTLKQAGSDFEKALKNANRLWNERD